VKIRTRKLTLKEQKSLIYKSLNYGSIISNPYKSILNDIVKGKYCGIYLIENPSEDLQLKSIKKYTGSISCINNPTKKVQIECVKRNPRSIFFINNPCQEAINMSVIYNLNLNEDKMINYIKYNPRNISFFGVVPKKVEDFIISECQDATHWLVKPSKRIQIWAIRNGLVEYVERYQLCKEALDYMKIRYMINENYYKDYQLWEIKSSIVSFLTQHNLDISIKELYYILEKCDLGLKPYLAYDIVDKLLEIDSFDVESYNIKDQKLLDKYSTEIDSLDVGLL
jgi:hypothetical protein